MAERGASPGPGDEEVLRDLWRRRATLEEEEWEQLYRLIYGLLAGAARRKLPAFGLLGTPSEYVQGFFAEKVFMAAGNGGEFDHAKVLFGYFERYLIDCQRGGRVHRGGGASEVLGLAEFLPRWRAGEPLDAILLDLQRLAHASDGARLMQILGRGDLRVAERPRPAEMNDEALAEAEHALRTRLEVPGSDESAEAALLRSLGDIEPRL